MSENAKKKFDLVSFFKNYTIIPIFICVFIGFSLGAKDFLSLNNFYNIFLQCSIYGVMCVGVTFLMINGFRDLSVGMVFGLASNLVVGLQKYGIVVAIAAALLTGVVFGLINGYFVTHHKMNTFVVTLATMLGARSLIYIFSKEASMVNTSDFLMELGSGKVFGINYIIILYLVLLLVGQFVLRKTKYGRNVYACGSNANAAYNAGINTKKTTMTSYVICSTLGAFAGILMASWQNASSPTTGWPDLHFMAMVMVIIGGNKLSGGIGNMYFTFMGVLIIQMMQNFLSLANVSSYYIQIISGSTLLLVLLIDKALTPKQFMVKTINAEKLKGVKQ